MSPSFQGTKIGFDGFDDCCSLDTYIHHSVNEANSGGLLDPSPRSIHSTSVDQLGCIVISFPLLRVEVTSRVLLSLEFDLNSNSDWGGQLY
jgi:hypothetical protein